MADRDRTTLVVAVAGIVATAIVGLAGTAAALRSAGDDRAAQRDLAREERTYARRTAAYLDALDVLLAQRRTWFNILTGEGDSEPQRIRLPNAWSTRVASRVYAFGSKPAYEAFERAEEVYEDVVPLEHLHGDFSDVTAEGAYVRSRDLWARNGGPKPEVTQGIKKLHAQTERVLDIVHDEIGFIDLDRPR